MSMRSSGMYAAVPTMPPGLVELMEGLTKDVLKNSPDNIHEFCALHMKKLIEIRDGKARKKSVEKVQRVQGKDLPSETSQKSHDTEMVAIETNDEADINEKEGIDQQISETDENSLNVIHEPEVEIEQRQSQVEENTFDLNESPSVQNEDDDQAKQPLEISSEIKEVILPTLEKSDNKSMDTSLSNENINKSISDKETEGIIEPIIICTTDNISESTPTNETNLIKSDLVNEEENQPQPTKSFDSTADSQSVDSEFILGSREDRSSFNNANSEQKDSSENELELEDHKDSLSHKNVLSNTNTQRSDLNENEVLSESNHDSDHKDHKENLSHMNVLDNTNTQKNDSNESEVLSESNHDLESSISDIQKDDCKEVVNHEAADGLSLESTLNLRKSNETTNSGERSIDVDNVDVNTMDLEKAAITIQKVFRAFLFKSKTLSTDEVTNIDLNYLVENEEKEAVKENKERRSGISRMDTVLQTVNEEKSLSLSTDDSSTLSSAATIIQAHVRGFLVRCKMPFNKTISTVSVLDSDIPSAASFDSDKNQQTNANQSDKNQTNKTILNIHIVPEGNNFISRDESLITSLDLSLDGSPRHSSNLHPLGYDRSERRKQLKREDAIQSVTPPSNNSGKLSEEVDSVKEIVINDSTDEPHLEVSAKNYAIKKDNDSFESGIHESTRLEDSKNKFKEMRNVTSDEADVVTPFTTDEHSVDSVNGTSKLLHSGEFHDIVLPTIVSRNNSSVVREFQNVLVYFLLWNPS